MPSSDKVDSAISSIFSEGSKQLERRDSQMHLLSALSYELVYNVLWGLINSHFFDKDCLGCFLSFFFFRSSCKDCTSSNSSSEIFPSSVSTTLKSLRLAEITIKISIFYGILNGQASCYKSGYNKAFFHHGRHCDLAAEYLLEDFDCSNQNETKNQNPNYYTVES